MKIFPAIKIYTITTVTMMLFAANTFALLKPAPAKHRDTLPSSQLLIVIADGWNTITGTLYVFNKIHGQWILQFSNAIVIGEKGLGAGKGVVPFTFSNDAPVKHEGDGKSPAGVFTIGTAFGYAPQQDVAWIHNDYVACTDTLICVDDLHSVNYNKLVQKDTAAQDYNSHEDMLLQKIYYKWGLVVNYNTNPSVAGKGSCIFMHIWGSKDEGTTGCTAMQEDDMVRLLHCINAAAKPLLVQLTKDDYTRFSKKYTTPVLTGIAAP